MDLERRKEGKVSVYRWAGVITGNKAVFCLKGNKICLGHCFIYKTIYWPTGDDTQLAKPLLHCDSFHLWEDS